MLHPDYPVIEGRYQMTSDWALDLPTRFNRRVEDGSLVLWRPGMTIWVNVWNNDHGDAVDSRLQWIRDDTSPDAFDVEVAEAEASTRYSYRLTESSERGEVHVFHGFTLAADGHVQLAIYVDAEDDIPVARDIWTSVVAS